MRAYDVTWCPEYLVVVSASGFVNTIENAQNLWVE